MRLPDTSPAATTKPIDTAMGASIDQIAASEAQLVIVCFGAPKQEQFLTEYGDRLPTACYVCCGASLDFVAGAVRRAPRGCREIGLEWAYRLAREPRRLWRRYLVRDVGAIPLFARMTGRRLIGRELVVSARCPTGPTGPTRTARRCERDGATATHRRRSTTWRARRTTARTDSDRRSASMVESPRRPTVRCNDGRLD